jgi:hypothetical protein
VPHCVQIEGWVPEAFAVAPDGGGAA